MEVHEAVRFGGFGVEVAVQIQALAFDYLDARVKRVGAEHVPATFPEPLEMASHPGVQTITHGARALLEGAERVPHPDGTRARREAVAGSILIAFRGTDEIADTPGNRQRTEAVCRRPKGAPLAVEMAEAAG